jgi:hypothetical protein
MQLSMELLPAPLGPMMERISCSDVERDVGQRLHAAETQADVLDVEDDVADGFVFMGCFLALQAAP